MEPKDIVFYAVGAGFLLLIGLIFVQHYETRKDRKRSDVQMAELLNTAKAINDVESKPKRVIVEQQTSHKIAPDATAN